MGAACLAGPAAVILLHLNPPTDVTKRAGSFVLILEGHPEAANDIDQATAVQSALNALLVMDSSNGTTPVAGYRVTNAYHALSLTVAKSRDGRLKASFGNQPIDGWVLEFAASAQQGWTHVSAFVVINARDGKVESISEAKNN